MPDRPGLDFDWGYDPPPRRWGDPVLLCALIVVTGLIVVAVILWGWR